MDKNDIVSVFFGDLKDKQNYLRNEERIEQYKKTFLDNSDSKLDKYFSNQKVLIDELNDNYMQRILSALIDKNTIFKKLENVVSVSMVNSISNFTYCFSYENNSIVLFDRNCMKLYWMLNKSVLYADNKDKNEQILLFLRIILNYISESHQLDKYPQPSTPPHEKEFLVKNLVFITEIQETFILAHEMAHLVLDKEKTLNEYDKDIINFLNQYGITEQQYNITKLSEEVEADRIAMDAVLRVYKDKADEKEVFESISSAIFLLIRYHLWITVAEIEITQLNDEYYIWLIRNAFVRKYINKYYKWGAPVYIITLLDYLENTLEAAALIASNVLKDEV
jgi:hypothetical protein